MYALYESITNFLNFFTDHRSQETVYIGLRLPKQSRHRHGKSRHRQKRRVNGDKTQSTPDSFKEESKYTY